MAGPDAIRDFTTAVQRHTGAVETIERGYEVALLSSPHELSAKPYLATDRDVIVIDTLRNSTSITVALAAGAVEVLLYGKREASLEEMYRAVSLSGRPSVIAGEIEGRPIPNAQCGNSPLDFRRPVVTGQTVFYSSTNNGSALQTLITLGRPRRVFWACLLNAPCVARALTRGVIAQPLLFLCAGFRGTLALEDLLTAGQILRIAHHRGFRPEALDDGSQAALAIASLYTSSDGTFIDPALVARHMATWRCGRVLEYMGQAHDVPATVSGQGIAPDLLAAARRCIPTLEAPATDHRIVALDAGVDP